MRTTSASHPRRTQPITIPFQRRLPEIPADVIELRIHGVSGTPPATVLKSYPIQLVGSKRFGIFRRVEGGRDRAYWWGGLTSGSWIQALWLLLFPFAFLNIAGWMFPKPDLENSAGQPVLKDAWNDPTARPTAAWRRRLKARALTIRLVALASSVVFVGMLMSALVETAALGPGREVCQANRVSVPGACSWAKLPETTRTSAAVVTATLLIAFVTLLSRSTRLRFEHLRSPEQAQAPQEIKGLGAPGAGFHRSAMWATSFMPDLLAAAHLAAALGALAWITLGLVPGSATIWRQAALVLVAFAAISIAVTTLVERTSVAKGALRLVQLAWWAGVVLQVWAIYRVIRATEGEGLDAAPIAQLLGMSVLAILVLFLFLFFLNLFAYRKRWSREGVVLVVGIGAVFAFGSGAVEGIVWLAGVDPDQYHTIRAWLAIGFLVTAILVACRFLWVLEPLAEGTRRDAAKRLRAAVLDVPRLPSVILAFCPAAVIFVLIALSRFGSTQGGEPYRPFTNGFLLWIAFPGLSWVDTGSATVAVLAPLILVLLLRSRWGARIAIGVVGLIVGTLVWRTGRPSLVPVAIWVTLLIPLVAVGYLIVRGRTNAPLRRGIGIIWDLAVFWPRWFHPWAPPPYTEVAIPDLSERLMPGQVAEPGTKIIVSGHSQGAVIAFAALRTMADEGGPVGRPAPDWNSIRLLTYGDLIGAHYRTLFPSFFTAEDVDSVRSKLNQRWINMYRETDPLGQPIPGLEEDDFFVEDPGPDRKPYGHSDYLYTPGYETRLADLANRPDPQPNETTPTRSGESS